MRTTHHARDDMSSDSAPPPRLRERLVLWQMRGAIDDLVCVVSPTTYGYTLGLELAGHPILVELQPTVERLVDKASRVERWLLTQGWEPIECER
ncbi:MAG: hypothetical protein ACRD2X_13020 [Vicinamibacteraceae bacterium]